MDTAPRAVQLIAQQLIGRTGRLTKTTMHTGAQQRGCRSALRPVFYESCQRGLHSSVLQAVDQATHIEDARRIKLVLESLMDELLRSR